MSEQWLSDLTIPQLRALASQNKIKGWATLSPKKLIQLLAPIENIEQPHPTFNVAGTVTGRTSYSKGQTAVFASLYGGDIAPGRVE